MSGYKPHGDDTLTNRLFTLQNLLATSVFLGSTLISSVVSFAQQKPQVANTKGSCSPIVYGHHNLIECGELSQHDAAMLADILNEARSSDKSLAEIKDMLQKALEGQDPNKTSITYWPDGEAVAINNSGGMNIRPSSGERLIFDQLQALMKERKWAELIQLAEKEKAKVPAWYTVYAYEGEAYAETCNYSKAIEDMTFFISKVEQIGNYRELLSIEKADLAHLQAHLNDPAGQGCTQ
jgi:hypothetical protein